MKPKVRAVIRGTGVTSVVLGVVLSPIPLADELLLVPIYGGMAAGIAAANGTSLFALPWRKVGVAIAGGLAVRAAANIGFAFVPGVAAVANAVSAAVLTEVLGRYVNGLCEKGAATAAGAAAGAAATA